MKMSLVLLLTPALAGNYNFAAKSVNLKAAYKVEFFKAHTMESQLFPASDAAACTGVELADGSYLFGGNAVESDGSTVGEGFAAKLDARGNLLWTWKSGAKGNDGILSVAELPNGEVLAAGYRFIKAANVIKRSLTKLNKDTGKEVWTMTDFGDTTTHGLFEMINVHATHGVILSGIGLMPGCGTKKSCKVSHKKLQFKSGGNTAGGSAVVQTMSSARLMSASTAPTIADVKTTKVYAAHMIAKTAHFMSATKVAVLLWREGNTGAASFGVFNPTTGVDLFTPVEHGEVIGQGTDMKLAGTTHAVITGHKPDLKTDIGYSGRLTKVSLADGKLVWSKEYSSCGFKSNAVADAPTKGQCSKGLIYNECWGVTAMADGGFVLSCGTGIEKCAGLSGAMRDNCVKGTADKRSGAYPMAPGVWASMTVKTDSSGALDWQRVDSYKCKSCPRLPKAPKIPTVKVKGEPNSPPESAFTSSAGEWALSINGGTGVVIVTDQQVGMGIQKFVARGTPPPPPPPAAVKKCVDDTKGGVEKMSGGLFTSCAQLAPAGFTCDHVIHGKIIRNFCPATCNCRAPACCAHKGAQKRPVQSGILVEEHINHMEVDTIVPESGVTML